MNVNINDEIQAVRITLKPYNKEMKIPSQIKSYLTGDKRFAYLIYLKNDLIGYIGLSNIKMWNKMMSLSYYIFEEHQKKDYCFEAATFLIEHAFNDRLKYMSRAKNELTLQPNAIFAVIDPDNIASKKLIARLFFKYHADITISGVVHNIHLLDYEHFDTYSTDYMLAKIDFLMMNMNQ